MLVGTYNAQYIGKTMLGFINMHEYCIHINKDEYTYIVEGITDLTEDTSTTAYSTYASENSLRKYWVIQEDITKLNKK